MISAHCLKARRTLGLCLNEAISRTGKQNTFAECIFLEEVIGFVKENSSRSPRRKSDTANNGARGEIAHPIPASAHIAMGREQRS